MGVLRLGGSQVAEEDFASGRGTGARSSPHLSVHQFLFQGRREAMRNQLYWAGVMEAQKGVNMEMILITIFR